MVQVTLELDEEIVEKAEEYSRASGQPLARVVSTLIEDFLLAHPQPAVESLEPEPETAPAAGPELGGIGGLTPVVRSLIGLLKDSGLSEVDYQRHLEERYL